jgi:hypothetical protein
MTHDRLIQIIALAISIVCVATAGTMLPRLIETSEQHALRYTDVSIEGAPPFVAIGTAIGALRGLIVDYLWIKVHIMKERGLFYEVMADAELITKLQPRFAAVWAFHGHNMAYNISVATHTEQERWEWVNAGIRLVRNQGLRYNPNDLELHRELAWWFAHKIEGVSDDAHLYYKTEFCREWHYILGQPPESTEDRIAWIRKVAEAPETLAEAERRTPGVRALVDRITSELGDIRRTFQEFRPDFRFLRLHGEWEAVTRYSATAEYLGYADQWRRDRPVFRVFDAIASDPEAQEAWDTLLAHVRKRVLVDEYNMDPKRMYRYTKELGPIDWRHGQAHALYWSRRGTELAEARVLNQNDIYKVLNNDRIHIQAMQDLARSGRLSFDPFSRELPSRFPEPRWIEAIEEQFHIVYAKHYETRGAGGETFITFLQNFMGSAIREWYRAGETQRAQQLLDMMDDLFGTGQSQLVGQSYQWSLPLDVFVRDQVREQYEFQPHLAPSDVAASLRYGIRVGIGQNRPEVYEQALHFANQVTEFFKGNEYYDYVNKFGRGRMAEIIGQLEQSVEIAFLQLMTDPTITLEERLTIWRQIDQHEPQLRLRVYDYIRPSIEQQYNTNPLSQRFTLAQVFPTPRGIEAYRVRMAQERAAREAQLQEQRQRDEIMRQ